MGTMKGASPGMSIMLDAKNARKRAGEILSLKKRNMEHQQAKMNFQMERELSVSTEQKRITSTRNTTKKTVHDSKEVVERTRKAQAGAQREQMQKMTKWRENETHANAEKNRTKCVQTRERREDMKKKREAEKEQQAQAQQQEYAKKISSEANRTKDAESLIMRMEQEEAALIERLRKTQEMQRQAYEELQSTLQL